MHASPHPPHSVRRLPQDCWPQGTNQAGDKAVQTPLRDGRHLTLTFPEAGCPQRIVFVLKEGEKWYNSGGGDFVAHLKPPGVEGEWLASAAACVQAPPPCRRCPAVTGRQHMCCSMLRCHVELAMTWKQSLMPHTVSSYSCVCTRLTSRCTRSSPSLSPPAFRCFRGDGQGAGCRGQQHALVPVQPVRHGRTDAGCS
jgi:hypothetical protein